MLYLLGGFAILCGLLLLGYLFVNANPGSILVGPQREFCRTWPNQQEVTVKGSHFVQEDSPAEIAQAVTRFLKRL